MHLLFREDFKLGNSCVARPGSSTFGDPLVIESAPGCHVTSPGIDRLESPPDLPVPVRKSSKKRQVVKWDPAIDSCADSLRIPSPGVMSNNSGFSRSFDMNQSLPSIGNAGRVILTKFLLNPLTRANGLNSLSLVGGLSPSVNLSVGTNQSLDQSGWSFYQFVRNEVSTAGSRNPHKAVFSLNAKTSRILIANKLGCRLLGVSAEEIASQKLKLKQFLRETKYQDAITEMEVDGSGDPVIFPGNVVEITAKNGKSVLVSLWVRLLNGAEGADENVAVAVAEPVIRADAVLQLGAEGKIVWFDAVAREIFDLSEDHLNEMDATTLLPKLSISSEMPSDLDCSLNHQSLVAKGVDGLGTFPVTVTTFESSDLATMCEMAAPQAEEFLPADFDFERGTHVVVVSIYGNLSGLVLVDEDGKIVDVNPSFALLTFGWNRAAVVGQSVKVMLPTFYRDCEVDESDSMPLPPMDDMKIPLESTPKAGRQRPESGIGRDEDRRFVDGTYSGTGLHSDGSKINVVYHVQFAKGNNNMEGSESTKDVYCVWISTATEISSAGLSESMRKVRGLNSSSLNASIANTTTESTRNQLNFGHYLLSARKQRWSAAATEEDYNETEGDTAKLKMWDNNDLNDESFGDDKDLVAGAYSKRYSVLESIGKGAFGCVKLASRIGSDSEEVFVTKFITKSQVHPSCRVQVGDVKRKLGLKALDSTWVPAEVDFLLALNHTNIVKAVEVFCNEKYFQLVMRRHGKCIIDLFDFIERRRPEQMPEDLAHHIFVQIADALRYLHEEEKIVHRDIKDENIILNERFDAQLIDFGSAAYLPSEKKGSRKGSSSLFYTFCGTYQYCSPEVILGNAYRGPELELWSLGVTLYTMMYKDNPFSSPEEIVEQQLRFPYKLTEPLEKLVKGMLEKDPKLRCTLQQCLSNLWMISMKPWSTKERILSRYSLADFVEHDGEFDHLPKLGIPHFDMFTRPGNEVEKGDFSFALEKPKMDVNGALMRAMNELNTYDEDDDGFP